MSRILKRPEAEIDLDEIWWYIAQDSPHNADKFFDRIQQVCLALGDFPHMGKSRDELKTGLRSHPAGSYLIFYNQTRPTQIITCNMKYSRQRRLQN